ncbi:MAG TPA: nicotinate-nucleotide adenylyltransferase, partial [Planctomycetaceae bacterium]|nr:nicotinate-nucleotide adenylyltransferase [Planctomycetaceae bacterium]
MRLGIFGGTFDPVHFGHLLLAEQCREQCRLDEIWFLPAGIPPHKLAQTIASGTARAEMLELAIAGHDCFRVDRRELKKEHPCYTVETLRELHDEDPSRVLCFLMGADSLRDFPTWREPARILELATLAVVNRGDAPAPDFEPLRGLWGADVADRVQVVPIPGLEISSSDIRRR